VRNPGQCIVRVVQQICPQLDVADALRDILVHVNRATANVVPEITFEYFIPNRVVVSREFSYSLRSTVEEL